MQRLAIGLLLFVLALTIAAMSAGRLEERDTFCLRCHLQPETTYVERAMAATAVDDPFLLPDLASYHYWQAEKGIEREEGRPFRCIDCHRGDQGAVHRLRVLGLAAGDTVTWAVGAADETVAKGDIANTPPDAGVWQGPSRYNRAPNVLNGGCRHCHQETLTLVGFDNHYHNRLPAAQLAYEETGTLSFPEEWPEAVGTARLLQSDDTVITCLDCHRAHVTGFETDYFLESDRVVFPACEQCHAETGRGPMDLVD